MKIEKLEVSYMIKNQLHRLGFNTAAELANYNFFSLQEMFPDNKCIIDIVEALQPLGYMKPPENEICINDVLMSSRLRNILKRYRIFYLSQLSVYSKQKILKFRNLGKITMAELEEVCKNYGIQIPA